MVASFQSLPYSLYKPFDDMKSEILTHRTPTTRTAMMIRRTERKVLSQNYARRAEGNYEFVNRINLDVA
jgi:hypothetical protein